MLQPSTNSIGLLRRTTPKIPRGSRYFVPPAFTWSYNYYRCCEIISEITSETVSVGSRGGVVFSCPNYKKETAILLLEERNMLSKRTKNTIITKENKPILFLNETQNFLLASLIYHSHVNIRKLTRNNFQIKNMNLFRGDKQIHFTTISELIDKTGLSFYVPVFLDLSNTHQQSASLLQFYPTQLFDEFWLS